MNPIGRREKGLRALVRSAARTSAWAAIAAGVLCGGAGCAPSVSPEAQQILIRSREAYERGDDEAVLRDTSLFLRDHGQTNLADVAYYLRGLAKYRRRDPSGAREDLKAAVTRTQRKDVRIGSLKALGDLAYETADMDWAENLYGEALKEIEPGKKPADEVRYRLGCVLQHKGRWREADEQFDRVTHVFAGTEIARRAERRLRCRAWAVQAAAFTRRDQARQEASRLRAKGLAAVARPGMYGGELRFYVQVGLYPTYGAAAAALPAVRKHRADAFVATTRISLLKSGS
jgi:tetratricopeptide (TPR) repeat protein